MKNAELKKLTIDWFNQIEHITERHNDMDISSEQALLEIGAMANRCRQFIEKHMED